MSYTTEQLIQILDQELRAAWKGERVLLSSSHRLSDPVVAKALGSEKLSKVFVYQDFRSQIHQYQIEHGVSGIVWRTCRFNDRTLRFPEIHNQLIPVAGDKDILIGAKEAVLAFWQEETQHMPFWRSGRPACQIAPELVNRLTQQAEWAEIDAGQSELYLGLCWGDPKECHYQWAYPQSRCERVIAAVNEPTLLKV
ncbi:MAG: hypothetical protein ACFB8W_08395 [Elainellaceae cyanobacterium]